MLSNERGVRERRGQREEGQGEGGEGGEGRGREDGEGTRKKKKTWAYILYPDVQSCFHEDKPNQATPKKGNQHPLAK
jgi:hypothetical protein